MERPSGRPLQGDLNPGRQNLVGLLEGRLRLVIEPNHVGQAQADLARERRDERRFGIQPVVGGGLEVGGPFQGLGKRCFARERVFVERRRPRRGERALDRSGRALTLLRDRGFDAECIVRGPDETIRETGSATPARR
jgi:hypothetical protein